MGNVSGVSPNVYSHEGKLYVHRAPVRVMIDGKETDDIYELQKVEKLINKHFTVNRAVKSGEVWTIKNSSIDVIKGDSEQVATLKTQLKGQNAAESQIVNHAAKSIEKISSRHVQKQAVESSINQVATQFQPDTVIKALATILDNPHASLSLALQMPGNEGALMAMLCSFGTLLGDVSKSNDLVACERALQSAIQNVASFCQFANATGAKSGHLLYDSILSQPDTLADKVRTDAKNSIDGYFRGHLRLPGNYALKQPIPMLSNRFSLQMHVSCLDLDRPISSASNIPRRTSLQQKIDELKNALRRLDVKSRKETKDSLSLQIYALQRIADAYDARKAAKSKHVGKDTAPEDADQDPGISDPPSTGTVHENEPEQDENVSDIHEIDQADDISDRSQAQAQQRDVYMDLRNRTVPFNPEAPYKRYGGRRPKW